MEKLVSFEPLVLVCASRFQRHNGMVQRRLYIITPAHRPVPRSECGHRTLDTRRLPVDVGLQHLLHLEAGVTGVSLLMY